MSRKIKTTLHDVILENRNLVLNLPSSSDTILVVVEAECGKYLGKGSGGGTIPRMKTDGRKPKNLTVETLIFDTTRIVRDALHIADVDRAEKYVKPDPSSVLVPKNWRYGDSKGRDRKQ